MNERLQQIIRLCPNIQPIIDVGADHGRVAAALGAIAVERLPTRKAGSNGTWIIADGLRPFRQVGVAIFAGMGARRIIRLLQAGPEPECVIAHPQDDPGVLREWMSENGWRLDAESLAPDGSSFAEIGRWYRGQETFSGLSLWYGPYLLIGNDPLRIHWLEWKIAIIEQQIGLVPALNEKSVRLHQMRQFLLQYHSR